MPYRTFVCELDVESIVTDRCQHISIIRYQRHNEYILGQLKYRITQFEAIPHIDRRIIDLLLLDIMPTLTLLTLSRHHIQDPKSARALHPSRKHVRRRCILDKVHAIYHEATVPPYTRLLPRPSESYEVTLAAAAKLDRSVTQRANKLMRGVGATSRSKEAVL